MKDIFLENIKEHSDLVKELPKLNAVVGSSIDLITERLACGNKLMICGNGGSAADSQHIAAEFMGRFIKDRPPIAAIALSTDTSALTCISNDYAYNEVFSRQLRGLGRKGDCLLAISTSGDSENVVKAVVEAKELGIHSVGLVGRNGGAMASLVDVAIVVPSFITARIQEAHILIGHTICGGVEQKLGMV